MSASSDAEMILNFESDFYDVQSTIKVDGAIWKAHAKIYRKDNYELIQGGSFGSASTSKKEALDGLNEKFELKKDILKYPPPGWGVVRTSQVVIGFYIKCREELSNFQFDLERSFELGELDIGTFRQGVSEVAGKADKLSRELCRRITQLSDDDKEGMLISSEDVYIDIFRPSNLDDVYARGALFDYIFTPSERMTQLYKRHQDRVLQEFEKQKL